MIPLLGVLVVLTVLVWVGRGGLKHAKLRPGAGVMAVFLLIAAAAMAVREAIIPAIVLAVAGAAFALMARRR